MCGGLLGFLFGIPRALQESRSASGSDNTKDSQGIVRFQDNTNLEQISDWLTKILVGVGLTQLTNIPSTLEKYATGIAPALGGFSGSSAFIIAIFIFFSVDGFLIGYLWTRVYFAGELEQSEASRQKIEKQVEDLSKKEDQSKKDTDALHLVDRVLNPPPGLKDVELNELIEAISEASNSIRETIYYKAQKTRRDNWRDDDDKPAMERTIPIFRALIAADTKNAYHTTRGQLGFALKDSRVPQWKEAETQLTQAIEIRGPWKERGGLIYEFNRAVCAINNDDEGFKKQQKSPSSVKEKILKDLQSAAADVDIRKIIPDESSISQWMQMNDIKMSDFADK